MAEMVDTAPAEDTRMNTSAESALVDWVVGNVSLWRDHRDSQFKVRWEEYYRLWRGIWAAEDKSRNSERSRLIAPALQSAIESVASEIESAILDKPSLFDLVSTAQDISPENLGKIRLQLRDDLKWADYETALNEIFLIGSIYGTGIGKLDVKDVTVPTIRQGIGGMELSEETRTQVKLVPIIPSEFIIDNAATSIDSALGCAHEYTTPRHEVIQLQVEGVYRDVDIQQSSLNTDPVSSDEPRSTVASNIVTLLDYQGKVPRALLDAVQILPQDGEYVKLFEDESTPAPVDVDNDDLVEALVIIANNGTLLKAIPNERVLKDRLFVAYRHETVPDQFWGRGVAEKGYNSQKALDASLRARIDGLALTVHPMMGIDSGKMPHGFKFAVSPGRTILTNGDPNNILRPMNFGQIDPNVFTNNAELERMVTQATGGMDPSAPVKVNNRNETASGMSMQLGNFVKRAKRTIRNIERELIVPMIRKTHRLYMEFEPGLYPALDVDYRVTSVLGNMARELEQQQFAAMLNTVEANSPAFWMLMHSIYQVSSLSNREDMLPLIKQRLQQSMQPPAPDPMLHLKQLEIEGKIRAEAARIRVEFIRAQAEVARAANEARLASSAEAVKESEAILNLAKAEAAEVGTQLSKYETQLKLLERDAAGSQGLSDYVIAQAAGIGTGSGQ